MVLNLRQLQPRDLVWDGCLNVRDLGGLPTRDGRETRFGAVVRADSVRALSVEGWDALLAYGVAPGGGNVAMSEYGKAQSSVLS